MLIGISVFCVKSQLFEKKKRQKPYQVDLGSFPFSAQKRLMYNDNSLPMVFGLAKCIFSRCKNHPNNICNPQR